MCRAGAGLDVQPDPVLDGSIWKYRVIDLLPEAALLLLAKRRIL